MGSGKGEARQQWGSNIEFLLSSISYAIGFGNIWRFPYLVYRYGGGTFLVPYFFFVIVVAMPLMLLESSTAQYAGLGPAHVYGIMCPGFKGLGLTTYYISYVNTIQYVIILGYVVRYAISSVTRELPWVECDPTVSFDGCVGPCHGARLPNVTEYVVLNRTCYSADDYCNKTICWNDANQTIQRQDPAFSYFYDAVLDIRHDDGSVAGWDNYGYVVPGVLGSVLVAYVLCFLTMKEGVSTSGKAAYFTALFPYVVLTILLVKAATLDGFTDGIKFYLTPDLKALGNLEVWYQALSQIFFSLGIGFGGLMTLSSYNKFDTPCLRMAASVTVCNCMTSIFAGFVIFGSLGYVAQASGQRVEDVAGSGMSLTFVTLATTLSLLPAAPVWSIMFFVMLITVGLGTQMADMETQITALLDQFIFLRNHKTWVTIGVCLSGFIGAISMTFQGGIWLNNLLNDYAATAPVLVMTLGNVISLVYLFGFDRLITNMEEMIGPLRKGTRLYLNITWKLLAPIFVFALLIYFFADFPGTAYDKPGSSDLFPNWVQVLGIILAVIPITFIPLTMCYQFVKYKKDNPHLSLREVVRLLFTPKESFKSQMQREIEQKANESGYQNGIEMSPAVSSSTVLPIND